MAFQRQQQKLFTDEASLYEHAVAALARRMRTTADLSRLLRSRVETGPGGEALILGVLQRLSDRGYLDDARYAAAYATAGATQRKFGRRRLALDLAARGVDGDIAHAELSAAFADIDEAGQARAFLLRKRVPPPKSAKEAQRVYRLLLRAGFAPGLIASILRSYQVPTPEELG